MKKMFLIAAASIALLSACSKDESRTTSVPELTDGIAVTVSFGHDAPGTRGVFDNTAVAEPWEKKINTLTLMAYSEAGGLIMHKTITPAEIANLKGQIYLPESAAGTTCTIAAVANWTFNPDNYFNLNQLNTFT